MTNEETKYSDCATAGYKECGRVFSYIDHLFRAVVKVATAIIFANFSFLQEVNRAAENVQEPDWCSVRVLASHHCDLLSSTLSPILIPSDYTDEKT